MKNYIITSFALALSFGTIGQFDPTPFIQGSQSDFEYLGGEYLNPTSKALASGINNGWYNSAEVHKPGRFEINFSTGIILVPEDNQSFIIQESKLDQLELVAPQDNTAPTAFGKDSPGPELRSKIDPSLTFETPSGLGANIFPQLNLNAEVGIGINTELMVRFFPTTAIVGIDNSKLGLYGFGINHSFLEWFDLAESFPIKASVMFGYTKLSYEQGLNTSLDGSNQRLDFVTTGYTARLVISSKFSFLTIYAGAGVNNGTTDIKLLGTYSYQSNGSQVTTKDPLDITQESTSFAANLGVKLNFLKIMSVNADYSFGMYQSITVGLGFDVDFK